ncbi:TonB-dependent receptor plug domain-containing protein [Dyella mobilis]|uniref:TonB-dependent receptor n=1 Tax=Dyella mobilis TaxID=1849582 RepID=A0ABS2KL74_9GAMM|nr:TonB-dependent receptor [Dyella mobilis]MBM7131780.1 TonB-dependent receptor [Dyella mobilis]GLQ96241.1 TonB-dependent receptor [Dyella mobilis]
MLKSKLTVAVLAAMAFGSSHTLAATAAQSQDTPDSQEAAQGAASTSKARKLDTVTVTGSLIPQSQVETSTPVMTITADQMKSRGFTTVAEALQQSSFSTGAVQGASTSASFTQGAQTLSMFGLPVGFVKYLIDGRPMGDFPALYNGSDAFNNLSGIPSEMVDHIDILPGGQSSIYGSDAIAGVVNIVLKKKLDAPVVDVRYGWHTGGGADRRVYLADSFNWGKLNVLAGVQFESSQPIWGFDRALTRNYYADGTSPATASRDFLVNSTTKIKNSYVDPRTLTPNGCNATNGLFNGGEALQYRQNSGYYCGSYNSAGYKTLSNDEKTANVYTHATFDATDNLQLYSDFLYNYQEQKFSTGSGYTWWGTSADFGKIYDANLKDFVNLQRGFTPEEIGGYKSIMNKTTENSYMLTLGGKGTFGQSNWDYDVTYTHSDDHLTSRRFARWANEIDNYFLDKVLGPELGTNKGYGVYAPNYGAFFQPISPADFRGFTGFTYSNAKTWDNLLRAQVTNASLFALPGGDAGLAVVVEGGNQGWNYTPDARLLDGEVWGSTDVQGAGHRSRYAATTELNIPLFKQLTLDASARYDSYHVGNGDVSHATYNIGIEYRPLETLLLRGKYGTAFKAPTLADEFQGQSGYYDSVTDYYNCAQLGYVGPSIGQCPNKYYNVQFNGVQSGNTQLKPITAKVWNYGFVWAPINNLSFSTDYYHYDISNEVNQESADLLSQQEYLCRIGTLDINSPTCKAALSQVVRQAATDNTFLGDITQIYTPKVNTSKEKVNALVSNFGYLLNVGRFGSLTFNASYSNVLKHELQQYPNDPVLDLLRNPYYSYDFKTKVNASITWSIGNWSTTVFANRYGSSPNYLARTLNDYNAPGAGRLAPWILYNASVSYTPIDSLALSLMVNNVFNKMPPKDHSYPGTSASPYNDNDYNVFGRGIYLEGTYKFGKAK